MPILPEAEIFGFASGSLNSGAAFAVAVPDLEIVVCMDPKDLHRRLQGRTGLGGVLDNKKVYKAALRTITDRLVQTAAFKFRRSAFRDEEPKVILLAPATTSSDQVVPLSLGVNNTTPFDATALLAECYQQQPKARALILLVRRWAKDRGLSHVAAGHLPPSTWTLLAIYFLQVGFDGGSMLLPPLVNFTMYAKSKGGQGGGGQLPSLVQVSECGSSLGELFKSFFHFFACQFDWRHEVVCPRLGRRGLPSSKFPSHILWQEDGKSGHDGPRIEDPFDTATNLGSFMTVQSFARLCEEFRRADRLCAKGISLTALLEPWAPPEVEKADQE